MLEINKSLVMEDDYEDLFLLNSIAKCDRRI